MIKLFEKYSHLNVEGKTLLVVDIQPAYQRWISFSVFSFIQFLNKNFEKFNKIIFFFNGPDMGYEDEYEFKEWLMNKEINEEVFDYAEFYDKGYNFFRTCIDKGIYEKDTVKLIQFMLNNDIQNSREFEKEDWDEFISLHKDCQDLRDFMEGNEDNMWIPELIEFITDQVPDNGLLLCGGHVAECLKEVEIALQVLEKKYEVLKEFIY